MSNETRVAASFRDPSGFVFLKDGVPFRQVAKSYLPHYRKLMDSGLYTKLVEKKLLVPHEEVETNADGVLLKPEKIPFISYPYEWSFSMLKDAALTTLRIHRLALKHGMVMKDASAFNIQFLHGKPVFIDTLSFETYVEGEPWVAYQQFCKHFFAPLVLASYLDVRVSKFFVSDLDGIPLDLAAALLPLKAKLNASVLVHIVTQGKMTTSKRASQATKPKVDKVAIEAIAENLEQTVKELKPAGEDRSKWTDYYSTCTYTDSATKAKSEAVKQFLSTVSPSLVFDVGANTGRFSRIAADMGITTVAMDFDPWCVEGMYRQLKQDNVTHLLPLVQDAMNPSPALGWGLTERDSVFSRGPADLVLALALIHHLAIANNVPLPAVAEFFSRLCRWLIIEFVPKSDVQVKSLLALREDIFPDYNVDGFVKAFSEHFVIVDRVAMPDSDRELFLFTK